MRTGLFRAWLIALSLLAGLVVPTAASAGAGDVGDPVTTCVRRAAPGLDPRALLAKPTGFDCRTPQAEFGRGDFLLLSESLSIAADQPVHVRSGSVRQARTTIHALYADGAIHSVSTDSRAITSHLQLGAIFEHQMPVRGVPVVRLLWHLEDSSNLRGILIDPRVASLWQSAQSNTLLAGLYAAFGGLCVALLIYNLALWCVMRHRFQLDYCVMAVALMVYAWSSSGALAWSFPTIDNNARLGINYVALGASGVSAFAFARSFFGPAVFAGWVGRAVSTTSALIIATAIGFAVGGPDWARFFDSAYTSAFLALMLCVPAVLRRAWAERNPYIRLFALTWAAPIGLAALRIARGFDVVAWSFWIDNSTLLAMVAEALLSTIAIAYRIHLLSDERDRAREDESTARALAATDPLTGLLNRRAFLADAIGRAGPQTLFVVDLDHFKRLNETIGHDGGDEVLQRVARCLQEAVPREALVARFGGEEFAIVADIGLDLDPARVLADLRRVPMPYDVAVTASIGVAQGSLAREADWKRLYRDADQALFAAKASGRDRVRRALAVAA